MNAIERIFSVKKAFIGMVHLRPTVAYAGYPGKEEFIAHAVNDAKALQEGGAHGICVENDRDQPHTVLIAPEQKRCIEEAVEAIQQAVSIPVGVGILLNDWRAALHIAQNTNSPFVRIDVFVDRVSCPDGQGIIEPEADRIVTYRKQIDAENIALFTDIQVKHKTLLEEGKDLLTSTQQAIDAGAEAVIVTGNATGEETPLNDVKRVKEAFPEFPVLIGAGVRASNVQEQFAVADGGFVGTSLKTPEDVIDAAKVREVRGLIDAL